MKLKSYLDTSESHPPWAYVVDQLVMLSRTSKYETLIGDAAKLLQKAFIQSWEFCMSGSRCKLPRNILKMFKVAKRYGVSYDGLEPTLQVKRSLPFWYHFAIPSNNRICVNSILSVCLRNTHFAYTVGEIQDVAKRNYELTHQKKATCECIPCQTDRANGCEAPFKCVNRAQDLLKNLHNKWNPTAQPSRQFIKLTPEEKLANEEALEDEEDIVFDPHAELEHLKDGFRVFTKRPIGAANGLPKIYSPDEDIYEAEANVYTDGSSTENGSNKAAAGAGIWFGPGDERNESLRLPQTVNQTSPAAELYAANKTASTVDTKSTLNIFSDSQTTIRTVTRYLPKWEDNGWIDTTNAALVKSLVASLRQRRARTYFSYVKAHSGIEGNERADELAKSGAKKEPPTIQSTIRIIPSTLVLSGAKLSMMTQSLAYRGIRALSSQVKTRSKTAEMIDMIQNAVEDRCEVFPSEELVWKSFRDKDTTRNVREWMWRTAHGAYWIGERWRHTPFPEREFCQCCNSTESLEHILTSKCNPAADLIWSLVKDIWLRKNPEWYEPTLGLILGVNTVAIHDKNSKHLAGTTRLYRILLTESAHLIWVPRCERVIQHGNAREKWPSAEQIEARWWSKINERLQLDRLMTNKLRFEKKAISPDLVLATWSGTLQDESNLPMNWLRQAGFLVSLSKRPGRHKRPDHLLQASHCSPLTSQRGSC